jgi:hypothetical protein
MRSTPPAIYAKVVNGEQNSSALRQALYCLQSAKSDIPAGETPRLLYRQRLSPHITERDIRDAISRWSP